MLGGGTGHGVPSLWGREGDCGRPARREFGGADLEQGIALGGQGRVGKRRVGMRIAAPRADGGACARRAARRDAAGRRAADTAGARPGRLAERHRPVGVASG